MFDVTNVIVSLPALYARNNKEKRVKRLLSKSGLGN